MSDALLVWEVVAGGEVLVGPPVAYDGETLVHMYGDDLVVTTPTGVWTHSSPQIGWLLDDAALGDGFVVYVEHEERDGDYALGLIDLASGAETTLEEWGGAPDRHLIPQISVDGHTIAWTTSLDDGRSCVRLLDVAADTTTDVVCTSDSTEFVGWPHLRERTLTYQLGRGGADPCPALHQLDVDSDEVPEPLPNRDCRGFQGASSAATSAWFEFDPASGDPFRSPVKGVLDGEIVQLGAGGAGSLTVCGGYFYWRSETRDHSEIRRWRPGTDVEVVYRSPEDWFPTTLPTCSGEWVAIDRVYTGVGETIHEVLVTPAS